MSLEQKDIERLRSHVALLRGDDPDYCNPWLANTIDALLRAREDHLREAHRWDKRGRPILCLDFDGVMHSYTSGWRGADICDDPPVPGLFEFLADAQDHFRIVVYSSRSRQPGGTEAMRAWLSRHYELSRFPLQPGPVPPEVDIEAVEFAHEKPPAFVTIDDRALTFDGVWPSVHDLLDFKPWNKR